jgi:crotonobetainyl-CoA:carnitine CoA-transferase CaiB-like acyl-CoA transferase
MQEGKKGAIARVLSFVGELDDEKHARLADIAERTPVTLTLKQCLRRLEVWRQETPMATDNIFSGLKAVDLASFVAGPAAAVILSDFGADVIKVEPPTGDLWRMAYKVPPLPRAKDNYPWHLSNRNKRGMAVDLKSPRAGEILERLVKWADVLIVNTPQPARKRLKLTYEDVAPWNPRLIYADLTGFGDKGPDAELPGFDVTAYWARSGLLSLTRDAGAPPTWPVGGSGSHATAIGLFSAIVMGLYRRERTGKGSYVTTSLLAEGVWATGIMNQAALVDAKFFPLHDRKNPPNAAMNLYKTSDGSWFLLVVTPDKLTAVAKGIGRADLLTDPRFADAVKLVANMAQLTAILDDVFGSQPMAHWREVFNQAKITFGVVQTPSEVIKDPQLRENNIVIPIEGAGGDLNFTISSPIQVHDVAKVPAKRAPEIGEHNDQVLKELGFDSAQIDSLRASGTIPKEKRGATKA